MTNIFRRLRELTPEPTVLIGEVLEIYSDQTSSVQYADGSIQRVRGTIVAVGGFAFVRNGVIETVAPARTAVTIEI